MSKFKLEEKLVDLESLIIVKFLFLKIISCLNFKPLNEFTTLSILLLLKLIILLNSKTNDKLLRLLLFLKYGLLIKLLRNLIMHYTSK